MFEPIAREAWTRKSCTRSGMATPSPPMELWCEKPRKCSGSPLRVNGGTPAAPLKVVARKPTAVRRLSTTVPSTRTSARTEYICGCFVVQSLTLPEGGVKRAEAVMVPVPAAGTVAAAEVAVAIAVAC
jgi:hypothetical protein